MRSWREVRPEVVSDEARVAAHRAELEAAEERQMLVDALARRTARISAELNRRLAGK